MTGLSATRFSIAAFCVLVHCSPKKAPADRAVVIVSTELRGYTAPCGCTSEPKGGLAKLAQLVADKRTQHPDAVLVSAGNFLFETAATAGPSLEQDEARARVVAKVFKDLGVVAQAPGPNDVGHGKFLEGVKNPWLKPGEWRVYTAADLRIAFVGLGDETVALTDKPPADVYVGLSPLAWQRNRELARAVKELDVIVSSGGGDAHPPATVGRTVVVDGGEQGQQIGYLEFFKGPGESWTYFDAGENEIAQTKRQIAALEKELVQRPDDALRKSRRDELVANIKKLQSSPPPAPSSKHVRYTLTTITKRLPDDAAVAAQVKAYNATLCEMSARATKDLVCPTGDPSFVGSEACGACHAPALQMWKTTKHAHAVKTLEDAGKLCDLGCIGCHTTGFDKPGGFCSPQKMGALKEVGCESCHGAGSQHAGKPSKANIVREPPQSTCLGCHTKDHSDLFDFATYRPRILGEGHGAH